MIIRLGTDRFWDNPDIIERWAEILVKLPKKIAAHSVKDIAEKYLGLLPDAKGRLNKTDELYGLTGAEFKNNHQYITGVNFIKKTDDGYILSDTAEKLADEYKQNRNWQIILAEQLLMYSIRTRSIIIALNQGAKLYFKSGFLKNMKDSYLLYADEHFYIFDKHTERKNLNDLLKQNTIEVLGGFWADEIKINIDTIDEIEFQGINSAIPSLKDISRYLKMPLLLFEYLGWLKNNGDGYYFLEGIKIKSDIRAEIFKDLFNDIFDEHTVLKRIISDLSDYRGFFPVDLAGKKLKKVLEPDSELSDEKWIDRYFMSGEHNGKFKIIGHEHGQPRHGRGLLGDKEYQLLKLEIY